MKRKNNKIVEEGIKKLRREKYGGGCIYSLLTKLRSKKVSLGPMWGRCSGDVGSMWDRCRVDVGSMWRRFAVDVGLM